MKMTSRIDMTWKNENDQENQDYLKDEGDLENEDNTKNEDDIENEDAIGNEAHLEHWGQALELRQP